MAEDEYIDLVERVQQAMAIEPFRPRIPDVIVLLAEWRLLRNENERLRAQLKAEHETAVAAIAGSEKEIERLRAHIAILTEEEHREIERLRAALEEVVA